MGSVDVVVFEDNRARVRRAGGVMMGSAGVDARVDVVLVLVVLSDGVAGVVL